MTYCGNQTFAICEVDE